jgi:Zn-dependent metalloprotease
MNKAIFKSIFLAASVMACYSEGHAQQQFKSSYSGVVVPVKKGNVSSSLKGKALSKTDIAQHLTSMLGLSARHTFKQVAEKNDKIGFTHTTYQQYYDGIVVDGAKILVHFKNGAANSINGHIATIGNLTTKQTLSEAKAVETAKAELGIVSMLKPSSSTVVIAIISGKEGDDYAVSYKINIEGRKADKTIAKMDVYIDAITGKVIKKVNLIHTADVVSQANTVYSGVREITSDNIAPGEYILKDNARGLSTMDFSKVILSGGGFNNLLEFKNNSSTWGLVPTLDSVSLLNAADPTILPTGNNWIPGLVLAGSDDADFPEQGPILDMLNSSAAPVHFPNIGYSLLNPPYVVGVTSFSMPTFNTSGMALFPISQADLTPGIHTWTDTAGNSGIYNINAQANPALDVHWGMERTYDYYKNIHDRLSYDDNGGEIINLVNAAFAFTGTQGQAAAFGNGLMIYGLGDRTRSNAFVTLDVTGHEFTHLVTGDNGNGGLVYEGESGALNESFSDIFGACIEFYAKGSDANWNIGEGIILDNPGVIRSMSNPKIKQDPDTYEGQYWSNTHPDSLDNGGVHINSGVQNKWFYLLCNGGSGTNDKGDAYNVTAIGMEKAQKIAYRNLINYLPPTSDYMQAYSGSIQATEDLYGDTSQVYKTVKHAWYAVGIGEDSLATAVNEIVVTNGDLKLYPNPATGRVTISSSLNQTLDAQVINVVGIPVMNITVSKGLNPVDISALAKGIYMIRYNTGNKGYIQKLSVL